MNQTEGRASGEVPESQPSGDLAERIVAAWVPSVSYEERSFLAIVESTVENDRAYRWGEGGIVAREKKWPFQCWICGRFAKFIRFTPYVDDFGGTVTWECSKCGRRQDGT